MQAQTVTEQAIEDTIGWYSEGSVRQFQDQLAAEGMTEDQWNAEFERGYQESKDRDCFPAAPLPHSDQWIEDASGPAL